jgi:hypothetical protein
MKKYLALGAALLAMSACNGSGDGGNAANTSGNASGNASSNAAATVAGEGSAAGPAGNTSAAPVGNGSAGSPAAASGANDTVQPGLWAMNVRASISGPGVPPGTGERQESEQRCLTAEDTRQIANPFSEMPRNMQCSERRFAMTGGTIDGRMSCRGEGGDVEVRMTGTYTGTSLNMRQEMSGRRAAGEQPRRMQVQIEGRRVGDQCTAESQRRGPRAKAGGER